LVCWCTQDDDALHIVMELCRGGSLQQRLKTEGALSEREAAVTMFCALHFLVGCHEQGVVYRDIKPENFMYVQHRQVRFPLPARAALNKARL
jgi:calcium-dependent protein kinase